MPKLAAWSTSSSPVPRNCILLLAPVSASTSRIEALFNLNIPVLAGSTALITSRLPDAAIASVPLLVTVPVVLVPVNVQLAPESTTTVPKLTNCDPIEPVVPAAPAASSNVLVPLPPNTLPVIDDPGSSSNFSLPCPNRIAVPALPAELTM